MFYLSDYLEHLRSLGRAEATIRQHRGTIRRLRDHLRRQGTSVVRDVTQEGVGQYLSHLRVSEMSPDRYRQSVARLRDYFAFLEKRGWVFLSPLIAPAPARDCRPLGPAPARQGITKLLDIVRTDRPFYVKGKAIMELGYSSALRPREIYGLELADIDAAGGQLLIRESKSRKDRVVPVGATALSWVRRYVDDVRSRDIRERGHDHVFIKHHNGAPENQEGIASAVSRTLLASGLPVIRPSEFRVIAATDLLRAGMHVVHISRLLGHSQVETTQRYLRLQESRLGEVLAQSHPRLRIAREVTI